METQSHTLTPLAYQREAERAAHLERLAWADGDNRAASRLRKVSAWARGMAQREGTA